MAAARKRQRTRSTIKHDRYYFTKVVGHPDKFSENIALSFRDVLSLDGKLTTTWQFTFMVDLDWLLEEYPDNAAEGPILLFLGRQVAHLLILDWLEENMGNVDLKLYRGLV